MKKQSVKQIIAFLTICAALFLYETAWAISLSFSPSDANITVGESIDVDIIVSGLENDNLAAFEFSIDYDDSILGFESYTLGTGLGNFGSGDAEDWSMGDIGNGSVSLSVVSWLWDFDFQADAFTLATVSFTGDSIGISALSFSDVTLSDEWGGSLQAGPGTGSVQVDPVPEPSAILLLSLGLAGIASLTRYKRN